MSLPVQQPIIASIERWSIQEAAVSAEGRAISPDVGFVDSMLRRRLSPLAKMVLRVAYDCAYDRHNVRFVYASRHGEAARMTGMLENLAKKEELSPLIFSLSVLNANPGLFSMIQNNHAPAIAVSAGAASFGYGLLQACIQWMEHPDLPVLFVYADAPLPLLYGEVDSPGSRAHAIGLLLTNQATRKIHCKMVVGDDEPSAEGQASAFIRCLEQPDAIWHQAGMTWHWSVEEH